MNFYAPDETTSVVCTSPLSLISYQLTRPTLSIRKRRQPSYHRRVLNDEGIRECVDRVVDGLHGTRDEISVVLDLRLSVDQADVRASGTICH